MKALIIEDDKYIALILRTWLEGCGYDVAVTGSMAGASKYIEGAGELEVITLDLNLEDSTHDRTIPRIKEIREKNPNALLVVISGVITMSESHVITGLGADAFIEKHDIPTERTFWSKLQDVVSSLIRSPQQGLQQKTIVLEAIASKIAKRCDVLGCQIGATTGSDPTAAERSSSGAW